jgi:RNA polymerase sigma-70 factor (ECF subfamily)
VGTRGTELRTLERDYASLDDRMLVLDFQAGHPEAFVEIHHRYGPLARSVCGRYLRNAQDADEAFQESMIRVFQGLHRFNGSYALRPWIARIATNVSIDAIRAHDRRPEFDDDEVEEHDHPDPDEGPEAAYERLIERDLVISVLSELPESHRTALVLRELEGRSHKEIGHAMGISSAQAKALIHRAKGSFRRGWLRAVTDRGGLAGIAMLPLIVTIKAFDGLRRVVDRIVGHAGQVVQAATPEAVTSAAASPPVTNAVTSVGERVVATGMAVLIAGSVTVGAASLTKHDTPKKDASVVAAAAVAPSPAVTTPVITAPVVVPRDDRPKGELPVGAEEPADEPTPSDAPSSSGTPSDEPSTSETPSTPPSDEPSVPPIPPAPAWTMAFGVGVPGPALCSECPAGPSIVSSEVTGSVDEDLSITQVVQGTASDLLGRPSWPLTLQYWATTAGLVTGQLNYEFNLGSRVGWFTYGGAAQLSSAEELDDGSVVLRFSGDYQLSNAPGNAQVPRQGSVEIELHVWADGVSVTSTSFSLTEG